MREVRVIFSKTGQAKYISHLDINRAMSRALVRAKIPLWYTEGFNPRPYMSFSLPLSLGVESECESMDLRIEGAILDKEIKDKLNSVLPIGLSVVDVKSEFCDCSEIAFSDYIYQIEFKDNEDAKSKIASLLESDEIIAQKKAKKGRRKFLKDVNIKDLIESYSIDIDNHNVMLNIRLAAGPDKNLNPTLFFDTLIKNIDMDYEWKSIKRTKLLKSDFSLYI